MAIETELEGIEYHGIPGVSQDCQDAVMRLLQFGGDIKRARIISCSNRHCLLLTSSIGDLIAVKSGFSSGYTGEGPRRFSHTLQFLDTHGVEIDECEVDQTTIDRLDLSALTAADVQKINTAKAFRPSRWHDYVFEKDYQAARDGTLWKEFRPVVPFAIIDSRIMDLALSFWDNPDAMLLKAYRRLEDIVRKRTGTDEYGARLFIKAFLGPMPHLCWKNLGDAERAGRAGLFTGAYAAYRNPRAHRERNAGSDEQLMEFLLLNHLYRLEKESDSTQQVAAA
jgi:hypothetical protein